MAITTEWQSRITGWSDLLKKHFYTPIAQIDWQGFKCTEHLTVSEADKRETVPLHEGDVWGKKWEYCWLKSDIIPPREAIGKRLLIDVGIEGESVVFVNGFPKAANRVMWSGKEHHHQVDMIISEKYEEGDRLHLQVEVYAGQSIRCEAVPARYGIAESPEPSNTERKFSKATYGVWNEEIYQLWLDYNVLWDIRNNIDENSLRAAEIDKALKQITLLIHFDRSFDELLTDVAKAGELLKPLLECKNGSTVPVMHVFGHSHLDVAWLWPLAETDRKCARTLGTQIRHLDEYPEYIYLQSQPYLYRRTKELYPELYDKIKEKVKTGQFIPEGGMWVEADTNITGGESLIRQFIHGKRFFMDEFGVENELLWLPDVFGYSGALPQIMKKCGINYFSTQKIFWTYNGGDRFPYHYFSWKGIDGSTVTSFIHIDYNSQTDAGTLINRWNDRVQKEGFSDFMVPFGYGDGGGGATRDHMENIRRMTDLEGVPAVKYTSPVDFFKLLEEKNCLPPAEYVGELYFQAHRGVLTSQAKTKKGNRKSEINIREAEIWGVMAGVNSGYSYPSQVMDQCCKQVLLNQFHDILPGSSIARVYEEAEKGYEWVLNKSGEVISEAISSFVDGTDNITVFNSLSWDRNVLVELPTGWEKAAVNGLPLNVCKCNNGKVFAEVTVPSMGMVDICIEQESICQSETPLPTDAPVLENDLLKVTFDNNGEITGIYDKETCRELTAGNCNRFVMYEDIPRLFEAWDIDSVYEYCPVELKGKTEIRLTEKGELFSEIFIKKELNESTLTQTVRLTKGSKRIDFQTEVDWRETQKLLKVAFPVNYHSDEAVHEIQFGHIKRPNHRSRLFDADRYEVCNHKWTALMESNGGAAVLNDCKYGVNVLNNSINLTLLRSPMAPALDADKGIQKFRYAFYAWNGSFMDSNIVREGYELNIPVVVTRGELRRDNIRSFLSINRPNIIADTIKPAEDGSGDVILRLYECKQAATDCSILINFPYKTAVETNMLETDERVELSGENGEIQVSFKPFEIKTIRLRI